MRIRIILISIWSLCILIIFSLINFDRGQPKFFTDDNEFFMKKDELFNEWEQGFSSAIHIGNETFFIRLGTGYNPEIHVYDENKQFDHIIEFQHDFVLNDIEFLQSDYNGDGINEVYFHAEEQTFYFKWNEKAFEHRYTDIHINDSTEVMHYEYLDMSKLTENQLDLFNKIYATVEQFEEFETEASETQTQGSEAETAPDEADPIEPEEEDGEAETEDAETETAPDEVEGDISVAVAHVEDRLFTIGNMFDITEDEENRVYNIRYFSFWLDEISYDVEYIEGYYRKLYDMTSEMLLDFPYNASTAEKYRFIVLEILDKAELVRGFDDAQASTEFGLILGTLNEMGFARAFHMLCDRLGLWTEIQIEDGTVSNIVWLDGEYYEVDTEFSQGSAFGNRNFLKKIE